MKVIKRKLEFLPEYDLRSICPLEEMLLFDIETTGLKKESTQLYLIGCAYYEDGSWFVKQWLTENASDEEDVLMEFLEFTQNFRTLVTFNGEGFDIPYIRYKSEYYMSDIDISCMESLDIYRRAKRARKFLNMKSMSQKSVEEYLGIYREDQLNGGLLIPVYYDYEKSGSLELERLLMLHNFDDIQGMIKILPIMTYTDCLEGGYKFKSIEECCETLILEFEMEKSVPVYAENSQGLKDSEDVLVCMDGNLLQISIRIYTGEGRLPLENVNDYYYLPDEDRVIHKDVAEFVEKSRRKKATKKNCFLKKNGRFIPQAGMIFTPAFYLGEDKKMTYIDYDEFREKAEDEGIIRLAADILSVISCC